jgi:hypothetical protein
MTPLTIDQLKEFCDISSHSYKFALKDIFGQLSEALTELQQRRAADAAKDAVIESMKCCGNCVNYFNVNCELRHDEVCDNWQDEIREVRG